MTTNTPAHPMLTDAEILALEIEAGGTFAQGPVPFARAIESALLSKLRAPVADERGGDHFRGATKMIGTEDLSITHRPLIREAIALLRLRQPAATGFERVASELEAALDGLPTPAEKPSPEWLEVAALASAPVAGEAQPSDVDILGLAGQYIQPSPVDVALQIVNFARALLSRYAAPQASEAVRDAGTDASEDVELPPLPSPPQHRGHGMFAGSQMLAYARAAIQADRQQRAGDKDRRAAFEVWWGENMNVSVFDLARTDYPMTAHDDQQYLCEETNRGWMVWKGCAALSTQPGAQKNGGQQC